MPAEQGVGQMVLLGKHRKTNLELRGQGDILVDLDRQHLDATSRRCPVQPFKQRQEATADRTGGREIHDNGRRGLRHSTHLVRSPRGILERKPLDSRTVVLKRRRPYNRATTNLQGEQASHPGPQAHEGQQRTDQRKHGRFEWG